MRKRTILLVAVFIVFVIGLALPKAEAATDTEKHSIKGLEGVQVAVEYLEPDVKQIGLTRKQIQTDVELKLRRNNINVSSEFSPFLYVNLAVVKVGDSPLFAYCIRVEFVQPVVLVRDPEKKCFATTWDTGAVGCAVELRARNGIRQAVKDLIRHVMTDKVDEFINDYLAVN